MSTRSLHPPARALAAAAMALIAPACGDVGPGAGVPADTATAPDSGRAFQGRVFERNVVFLTTRADSAILVPWLVTARTRPGGVDRTARGLLARGGTWESFFDSSWESPPTRVPWRILPRESMRLIVGDEENLDGIVFEEGARQLHVILGDALVEWGGQRGETFRIVEGALLLASQRVPGVVLDMSRARRAADAAPGDWAVLTSGDSLQVVLHRPEGGAPGAAGAWRGWARTPAGESRWPALTVEWSGTRAFERARREVPVNWSLSSAGGEVSGSFRVRAAELRAGEGEGPQLPVAALFDVGGTLTLDGREYPVAGLLHHEQR